MARKTGKSKKSKNKGRLFLVMGAIMAAVFLPTSTLLFVGMMPTIAAYITDRTRKKTRVFTVGALNFAGCYPFLLELWMQGSGFEKSVEIILEMQNIIIMYIAATIGYLIDWSISGVVAGIVYQSGLMRVKAIEDRQEILVDRWGPEVTGRYPLDKQGFKKAEPVEGDLT